MVVVVAGAMMPMGGLATARSFGRAGLISHPVRGSTGAAGLCRGLRRPSDLERPPRLSLQEMQLLSKEWWKYEEPSEDRLESDQIDPASIAAIILGGGAGDGLYPLTMKTAKGAVPIGGAYRLIDIPLSNCIKSNIFKMYVLTQYNSSSLNRYIARTYDFGQCFGRRGFVEVLTATMTPNSSEWFGGTADAIRRYSWAVDTRRNHEVDDVIILKTDHLYKMDFQNVIRSHRQSGADITICTYPVPETKACHLPLVKADSSGRVVRFVDKPPVSRGYKNVRDSEDDSPLSFFDVIPRDPAFLDKDLQILGTPKGTPQTYLASMGIYVFKKRVLFDLLNKEYPDANDFGADMFPKVLDSHYVVSYMFNGFWEDVSSIKSYFEAQAMLSRENFLFYDVMPEFTEPKSLPASCIDDCEVHDAVINQGCNLRRCSIRNAVLGVRQVATDCVIENAILQGSESYESPEQRSQIIAKGEVPLGVGSGTVITNAIISENCRIGRNCQITNEGGVSRGDYTQSGFCIQDGIVVVMPGVTIPDGTVI